MERSKQHQQEVKRQIDAKNYIVKTGQQVIWWWVYFKNSSELYFDTGWLVFYFLFIYNFLEIFTDMAAGCYKLRLA